MKLCSKILQASLIALCLAGTAQLAHAENRWNQPTTILDSSDRATRGKTPSSSPQELADYAKIIRAVDLALNFQTKGGRGDHKIGESVTLSKGTQITAKVRVAKRKDGKVYLDSLDLKPTGGNLTIAGKRITRVRFNSKGELKLEIKSFPDLTITNITKEKNGDTRIHVKGYPDITIKKNGKVKFLFFGVGQVDADFKLPKWPPELESLMQYVKDMPKSENETKVADIVSDVSWRSNAVVDAGKLELGSDYANLPAGAYNVYATGAAKNINGQLQTVGDNNQLSLTARFDSGKTRVGPSDLNMRSGSINVSGKYRLSAPIDGSDKRMFFEFDGRGRFQASGNKVDVLLPGDTRIYAEEVETAGSVDARFTYAQGRPSVDIKNGEYSANLKGPIKLEGLAPKGLNVSPLNVDGRIDLSGQVKTENNTLIHNGTLKGRTTLRGKGAAQLLRGEEGGIEASTEILKGSKINADVDFTTYTPFGAGRGRQVYKRGTTANGKLDLELLLGNTKVKAENVDLNLNHGPSRINVSGDFDVRNNGDKSALRDANLRVNGQLGGGEINARTPVTEKPASWTGVVTASRLNVRSGPGASNVKVNSLPKGSKVEVLKSAEDDKGKVWYMIRGRSEKGTPVLGYVHSGYLDVTKKPAERVGGGQVAGTLRQGSSFEFNLDGLSDQNDVLKNFGEAFKNAKAGGQATLLIGQSDIAYGALRARVNDGEFKVSGDKDTGVRGSLKSGDTSIDSGDLNADLKGETDVQFESPATKDGEARQAMVTVRIALRAGSTITYRKPGSRSLVSIKGDGSFISFKAEAQMGPDGKPMLKELKDVNLKLELGNVAAQVLGKDITAPGEKTISLTQGRIVLLDNGLDIFGDFAIRVRSVGDTPAFSVRW